MASYNSREEALNEVLTNLIAAQGLLMVASLDCDQAEVSFDTEITITRARNLVAEAIKAIS